MVMTGKTVCRSDVQNCIKHWYNRFRCSSPDCVAEAHFMTAKRKELFRDISHCLRGCWTIIGAFHHAAYIAANSQTVIDGSPNDRCKPLDAFRNRAVDIGLGETFGSRNKNGNFIDTSSGCRFIAPHIRHQCRITNAAGTADTSHDVRSICQLWHPFGADETRCLYTGKPAIGKPVDQRDLVTSRHKTFFILQAVTRCHFDDFHVLSHVLPPVRLTTHPH